MPLLHALYLGHQTVRGSYTVSRLGRLFYFFKVHLAITLSTSNQIILCSYYVKFCFISYNKNNVNTSVVPKYSEIQVHRSVKTKASGNLKIYTHRKSCQQMDEKTGARKGRNGFKGNSSDDSEIVLFPTDLTSTGRNSKELVQQSRKP